MTLLPQSPRKYTCRYLHSHLAISVVEKGKSQLHCRTRMRVRFWLRISIWRGYQPLPKSSDSGRVCSGLRTSSLEISQRQPDIVGQGEFIVQIALPNCIQNLFPIHLQIRLQTSQNKLWLLLFFFFFKDHLTLNGYVISALYGQYNVLPPGFPKDLFFLIHTDPATLAFPSIPTINPTHTCYRVHRERTMLTWYGIALLKQI